MLMLVGQAVFTLKIRIVIGADIDPAGAYTVNPHFTGETYGQGVGQGGNAALGGGVTFGRKCQ